ncbi:hypothetical protein WDU94_009330 [Cyamophila willieti]
MYGVNTPGFLHRTTYLLLALCIQGVLLQVPDNRCFLEDGGSAESFFVNEDLPIGSVIGKLHILGDPGEHGNIELRLKELDSPVVILSGTKELSLVRRLDKEGIDGPSSVYINVLCEKKRNSDPGFLIPVNIRVTDANDNAPQFVNAPYVLNISEVTVVGTRVLQGIKAIDADQQGPFSTVQYSVSPGPYADYFVFVNGLEGTLVLRKPLDYETLQNFTITIRAQDQGNPPKWTDTTLYVNVIDADDQNPKFYDENYSAILPENAKTGLKLDVKPREMAAFDQDLGIKAPIYYTLNSADSFYQYFNINKATGNIYVAKDINEDDFLQPVTLVVRAIQYDNQDRYALATLVVSKVGTSLRELQFSKNEYSVTALENLPVNYVLLTVSTNKPRDPRVKFWLSNGYGERFSISRQGDIILMQCLDYETEDNYKFMVYASDSVMTTSATVNITVLNVNDWDPRFRYPQYEFFLPHIPLTDLTPGSVIGKVEAADGDKGDRVTLSLRGPYEKMFSINDSGHISIVDLTAINTSTIHLVAVATDTGTPPRQASVPAIIHFPEAVVLQASSRLNTGSNSTVLFILAAVLIVLGFVIIMLIVYIHKNKRTKENSSSSPRSSNNKNNSFLSNVILPEKHVNVVAIPKIQENPVFNGSQAEMQPGRGGANSSIYTATVKTNRPSQFNSLKSKQKLAPQPPQVPKPSPSSHNMDSVRSGSSNVMWPVGTIPRRVKKLSWDDEADSFQRKPELDPEVGVTPLVTDMKTSDSTNLTVYF